MPLILPYKGKTPKIAPDAFIAPNAVIIGDVEIGSRSSIWFNCVIRADVNYIRIGARTNIQDGTIIHVDSGEGQSRTDRRTPPEGHPTIIGDDVLVGHMAMIHGCTLESGAFVGLKATLLDGVVVEGGAMVAAAAFVTPFKRVPRGEIWAGVPAKRIRDLSAEEIAQFRVATDNYAHHGDEYRAALGD